MILPLAYAASGDPNELNLPIILTGVALLFVVCCMAFLTMFLANSRRHRRADSITTATIFWALLAAGTLAYTAWSQLAWSNQYTAELESGYLDPSDTADRPALPWKTCTALSLAYAGLIAWSLSQHNPPPPDSQEPDAPPPQPNES